MSAVMNIILNYIGLQTFGYVAAAYTTFICYALYALFHYIVMKKLCKKELYVEIVYNGKFLVGISAGVILCGLTSMMFYRLFIIRLIVAGIVIAVTLRYAVNIMNTIGHKAAVVEK